MPAAAAAEECEVGETGAAPVEAASGVRSARLTSSGVKAAGVTFAVSALERVIEERARGDHAKAAIPMAKVIAYELEIRGSHGMQAFRYGAMMEMIRAGKLKPDLLIGKTLSLDEAPAALMAMGNFEGIGIGVVTRF